MLDTDLSASLEDYLETIYQVIQEQKAVRAKDIASRLGVTNASVTGALRNLAARDFLNYEPYGVITLTQRGSRVAVRVVRAHEALRDFLVKVLAVPKDKADTAACQMEHAISSDILERFIGFIDFMGRCPEFEAVWDTTLGFQCGNEMKPGCCARSKSSDRS